jgi:SAM-dependent methyltransferase
MKPFELTYLSIEPLMGPLYWKVRRQLLTAARNSPQPIRLLDVGGRKSHYTIGVPARVTITDLPRDTDLQKQLNLGVDEDIIAQLYRRRSNVRNVLLDDMTRSALPDSSFDCVVAVEVLEHVEEDRAFLQQVHRVLKPGGIFLMTTPNGDWVKNSNPDHKRHYARRQLQELLSSLFVQVEVNYAIEGGLLRRLGLRSWSIRRPLRTILTMGASLLSVVRSSRHSLNEQEHGTHHLIATARKGR